MLNRNQQGNYKGVKAEVQKRKKADRVFIELIELY